ncbi:MAG TPA: DUF4440 domain-containing protein [Dongiaceae bacterium]|nr:DUF4440 domain-containing protein [Dongiaceae bacterium]
MDNKPKNPSPPIRPLDAPITNAELQELYRRLRPELLQEKPSPEALAAAMEAAQRLAAESDAEDATTDAERDTAFSNSGSCKICGYQNREGYKFCAKCGVSVEEGENVAPAAGRMQRSEPAGMALPPNPFRQVEERMPMTQPTGNETHHFHHHYHHHYFPGSAGPQAAEPVRDSAREVAREEKLRSAAASLRGDLTRAEAAVRAITQEWVLACNTKHLDDLLEVYAADALVLRSNCPPIRGAAAVREFFFGALDAGLGEVEIDPLRVDIVGDMAYEAGRCKALIPGSTGKRREERGKYLWVLQREPNGQWKVVADCWSSDLTLTTLESDIPTGTAVKTSSARK